ncbi:Uncharacterised protein [Bordetella pertussis]|nr:Uncharacterised protein [Bordetella pertussis]CPN86992.1 Uncharacterised protein [Bordetella pertussis]
MNEATNVLAGRENTLTGLSNCCTCPDCMTAILSAVTSALPWSCVT